MCRHILFESLFRRRFFEDDGCEDGLWIYWSIDNIWRFFDLCQALLERVVLYGTFCIYGGDFRQSVAQLFKRFFFGTCDCLYRYPVVIEVNITTRFFILRVLDPFFFRREFGLFPKSSYLFLVLFISCKLRFFVGIEGIKLLLFVGGKGFFLSFEALHLLLDITAGIRCTKKRAPHCPCKKRFFH